MSDEDEVFTGWKNIKTGESICIGRLPGRKSYVLYELRNSGSSIHPLAYFKTEEEAAKAAEWLDYLASEVRMTLGGLA